MPRTRRCEWPGCDKEIKPTGKRGRPARRCEEHRASRERAMQRGRYHRRATLVRQMGSEPTGGQLVLRWMLGKASGL